MKFEVEKSVLISGIYNCYKIADTGTNINPILTNVQIEAMKDGVITCKATDAGSSILSTFKGDVTSPGKITVSARLFYNLSSGMSGKTISIEKSENQVIISSLKSEFKLNIMRDEDFPTIFIPEESLFSSFEPVVLSEIIDKTLFSVSTDDAKQYLTGIFFICKNNIAISVSTDGHRLSMAEYAYEGEFSLTDGVIIPFKGAREIKRIADGNSDSLELAYIEEKKMLALKSDTTIITVKIIDSKFPPYEQVIPSYKENILISPKEQIQSSLKRIRLLSQESEPGVIIKLEKDKLFLAGTDTSKGVAHEEIEVDYEGEQFSIAFNIKFLEQILSKVDGPEIKMLFGGQKAAALINPVDSSSFKAVIMPLKLA
jgi:DNA polymerase III subunit beta